MEYSKKTYLLPMRMVLFYLIFSLLLYAFGPFRWETFHPIIFWTLNIFFLLSIWAGWIFSLKTKNRSCKKIWNKDDEYELAHRLKMFIWINIVFEILNTMRRFRLNSFDVFGILDVWMRGLENPGLAYSELHTEEVVSGNLVGGLALTIFNLAFSFFSFNIFLLAGILFKRYNCIYRFIIVFMYVFVVLEYLSTGTNIGAFRVILAVIVFWGIKIIRAQKKHITFKSKEKRIFILASIVGIVAFLSIFNEIMQSRGGILMWASYNYNVGGVGLDRDSFIFEIIPSDLWMFIIAISSYISQGYYGMSLSLTLDWEPCFGLGHTKALYLLMPDLLEPIYHNTYQHRLNGFGWDEDVQWHTLYSWFANDFSYIGVIFVMFIIGFVFCKAYYDVLTYNNPYAKLVTYYFVLMCVFIPCNNQVFQSSYILFAFIGAMIVWIFSRRGVRVKL